MLKPQPGPQTDFCSSTADIVIYGGAAGGGKALQVDTPLLTTNGWKRMGDITTDDFVYSNDGKPTRVLCAYDPYVAKEMYRVVFDCGAEVFADGEHLWETLTELDRGNLHKTTSEYREKRRAKRQRRGAGKRPDLAMRNSINGIGHMPERVRAGIRTTAEISKTLKSKRGAINHSIECSKPINGTREWGCDINPYILGAWLGDGTACTGVITIAEKQMLDEVKKHEPKTLKQPSQKYGYRIPELTTRLNKCGLINNKKIPEWAYPASVEDRLALIQGLMDTDGTIGEAGRIEFSVTNRCLAEGFLSLAASIGIKVTWNESNAVLCGKITGRRYRLNFRTELPVFRIKRKLDRQKTVCRDTTKRHFILRVEAVAPSVVRCISVDAPNKMYLAGISLIPTHNSYGLLLEAARNTDHQHYRGVIFRRTFPELVAGGGLCDTAGNIYPLIGGTPKNENTEWAYLSGAKLKLTHMQHEKDKDSHYGAQYSFVGFDELITFTRKQVFFLLTRCRPPDGYDRPCYIRATTNPQPGWVADLIQWWWDPATGYPILERAGVVRYFTVEDDQVIWVDEGWRSLEGVWPYSITFIPAKIDDNKILLTKDPNYKRNLYGQERVMRERLLYGNWLIDYSGGMFDPGWFKKIKMDELPKGLRKCRYWDFAASEVKEGKDPDWTAGPQCGTAGGNFYIISMEHFREAPGTTTDKMIKAAHRDSRDTIIAWEEEKGSAGRFNSHHLHKELVGYETFADPVSGDKVERAKPLAAAAEHGLVYIVEGDWNQAFLAEAGSFPNKKRDQIDAVDGAMKVLTVHKKVWPEFNMGKTLKFQINWEREAANCLHYAALVQQEDLSVWYLAAIYDTVRGELFVYDCTSYPDGAPGRIAGDIILRAQLKRFRMQKIIGNEKLFGTDGQRTADRQLKEAFRKLKVEQNIGLPTFYEMTAAAAFIGQMFLENRIYVHTRCMDAAQHIAGWTVDPAKGRPTEKDKPYATALCHIGSELRQQIPQAPGSYKGHDYYREEKKLEKLNSWLTS